MNIAPMREPTATEVEVEQCVLALLLEGSETAWFVLDRIDAADMLEPLHARIVDSVRRVLDTGGEPNPLTVAAAMASDAGLNQVGGADYLRGLRRFGSNKAIADELCAALADHADRRALAHEIAETETRLLRSDVPAKTILAEHEAAVTAIMDGKPQHDDPVSLYDVAAAVCERLEQPDELRKPLVPYGIAGLDESIGGMAPGDLIILAARPGMGKTAAAIAIGDAVASRNIGVFFASLEMRDEQLAERWLSMRAYRRGEKVPYSAIRLNRVGDSQKDVLAQAAASLGKIPLVIDKRRGQTVSQICTRARSIATKMRRAGTPLGLVIIDHLQLIEPDGAYRGNKVAEVTEISRALKILAGSLDIPILALSQLNRAVESRDDKKPQLSDLRESGAIEQDADVVLLLHRPEYYAAKNRPDAAAQGPEATVKWEQTLERSKGFLTVHAAKVRHGKEDEIKAACEIGFNYIGGRIT